MTPFDLILAINEIDREATARGEDADQEQIKNLEQQILTQYNLPYATKYVEMIHRDGTITEHEAEQILNSLRLAARKYVLSNHEDDFMLLERARKEQLGPAEVFPEMGIVSHPYTLHIYQKHLLGDQTSIEKLCRIFKAAKNMEWLEWIDQLTGDNEEGIDRLSKKGFDFLEEYLQSQSLPS